MLLPAAFSGIPFSQNWETAFSAPRRRTSTDTNALLPVVLTLLGESDWLSTDTASWQREAIASGLDDTDEKADVDDVQTENEDTDVEETQSVSEDSETEDESTEDNPTVAAIQEDLSNKRWSQAARTAKAALEEDPDNYKLYTQLGTAQFRKGNHGQAYKAYREALKRVSSESGEEIAGVRNGLANITAAQGNTDEAIRHARAALKANPNDAASTALLANLRIQQGDQDAAIPMLRKAVELDPKNTQARLDLIHLLLGRGDEGAARDVLGGADPKGLQGTKGGQIARDLHMKQAETARNAGNHQEALASAEKAATYDSENPDVVGHIAQTALTLKDYDKTIQYADLAIAKAPNNPYLHRLKAAALGGQGKNREALEAYKQAYALSGTVADREAVGDYELRVQRQA